MVRSTPKNNKILLALELLYATELEGSLLRWSAAFGKSSKASASRVLVVACYESNRMLRGLNTALAKQVYDKHPYTSKQR